MQVLLQSAFESRKRRARLYRQRQRIGCVSSSSSVSSAVVEGSALVSSGRRSTQVPQQESAPRGVWMSNVMPRVSKRGGAPAMEWIGEWRLIVTAELMMRRLISVGKRANWGNDMVLV